MSGWFREEQHKQGEQKANNTTDEAIKQLAEQVSLLAVSVTQITRSVTEVKTTVTAFTQGGQKAILERTEVNTQPAIIESLAFVGEQKPFAANTKSNQGEQDTNIEQRIRNLLTDNPGLSDHKIAAMVGCSSSTANKWRKGNNGLTPLLMRQAMVLNASIPIYQSQRLDW